LTRSNTRAAQERGLQPKGRKREFGSQPAPSCRTCGVLLADRSRQLCPSCWSVTRRSLANDRAGLGLEVIARRRANGEDPTNSAEASAKRSASLSMRKREQLDWQPTDDHLLWTVERFKSEVLPVLGSLPLSAIARVTGLSVSACSRIRSGKLMPHARHWQPLSELVDGHPGGSPATVTRAREPAAPNATVSETTERCGQRARKGASALVPEINVSSWRWRTGCETMRP
jgi:hypothetical protein